MKPVKYFLKTVIIVALLTAVGQVRAQQQYLVEKTNGKKPLAGTTGIYYALPKTVLKVQLVMEEVRQVPGPYAQYTQKYLGTDSYIRANTTYYKLLAVKVRPVSMTDPSHVYFVQFPKVRSSKNPRVSDFQMNEEGELIGYGMKVESKKQVKSLENTSQILIYSNNGNAENFNMAASFSRARKLDTLVRKITVDTVTIKRFKFRTSWINLTQEEQAEDAAKEIHKIRVNRFNLLTGYQEVNYGAGIKYMDVQLRKLEDEYLALFLGKETKTTIVRSFVFDPEKGHLSRNLFEFMAKGGNTEAVTLTVDPMNEMNHVPATSVAAPDELFYRIPVKAKVSVVVEGNAFYSNVFTVPQLGVVTTATMTNSRLQLDPSTGALVRIIAE